MTSPAGPQRAPYAQALRWLVHALVYLLVAIAGATTIGSQILLYAYVAQYYPLAIRSTGIGWASGVGRLGAISGPMLGGALISMPLETNFLAFAIPGAIAGLAIALIATIHQGSLKNRAWMSGLMPHLRGSRSRDHPGRRRVRRSTP